MILAIKNKNYLHIESDELLKDAIIEIKDETGKLNIKRCSDNNKFEIIRLDDYKGKLSIRIKAQNKTIYQKVFNN